MATGDAEFGSDMTGYGLTSIYELSASAPLPPSALPTPPVSPRATTSNSCSCVTSMWPLSPESSALNSLLLMVVISIDLMMLSCFFLNVPRDHPRIASITTDNTTTMIRIDRSCLSSASEEAPPAPPALSGSRLSTVQGAVLKLDS